MNATDLRRPHAPKVNLPPLLQALIHYVEQDGRTQEEICRMSGMAHNTLSKWRHGAIVPRIENFEAMANVLGYRLSLERIDESD